MNKRISTPYNFYEEMLSFMKKLVPDTYDGSDIEYIREVMINDRDDYLASLASVI